MIRHLTLAALLLLPVHAALAGTPTEAVAWFYDHVGDEALPENRDRFAGDARKFLDANDRAWNEREYVCLDFGFSVDGQDYDQAELQKTLKLEEQTYKVGAVVTATFKLFGEDRNIEWLLQDEDDAWKVVDVISVTGNWRLSDYACE